jgi:hypothetical protein
MENKASGDGQSLSVPKKQISYVNHAYNSSDSKECNF